ncbi:MAG: DUF58 domain-containing protein [Solimonas sp.]
MRLWLIAKIALHPLRYAQQRIDTWVMARVKRQPGPIDIPRHRVYILPTRFGYGFAIMLLVMLLGAMNYSNSMAFLLTFLLSGLGMICMHHTHANLVNLQLRAGVARPVFAGETAHAEVHIDNPSAQMRLSIGLSWPRQDASATTTADVPAQDGALLRLPQPAAKRGWLRAGVFSVSTDYPLGLFHAWTWAELDTTTLVFPAPAPPGLVPPGSAGQGSLEASHRIGQDEFSGLRSYQRGDTARAIHWKSLPKSPQLMVKQFQETLDQDLWLDWSLLPQLDREARLSQLTRWVLDAEALQRRYGLRLPGTVIAPGHGEAHAYQCLKALALFEADAA